MTETIQQSQPELTDKQLLKKVQEMFSVAIEVINIDTSTIIILSRKILELVVHNFYEANNIKKAKNAYGQPTLYMLIKNIEEEKLAPEQIITAMNSVKDKGNKATHDHMVRFSKAEGIETVENICGVLVWVLENRKLTENSLYLLCLRRSKQIKGKLAKTEFAKELNVTLINIFKLSVIVNSNKFWDWLDAVDMDKVIDPELENYLRYARKVLSKYYRWYDKFDEVDYADTAADDAYNWVMTRKINEAPTPGKFFREFYGSLLDSLDEMKEKIINKYNY